jgi:NitT/TauT family transport system permease protein
MQQREPGAKEVQPLFTRLRPHMGEPAAVANARRETIAMIVVVASLFAAMEVASRFVPDYIMPSPLVVLKSLLESMRTEQSHIWITLARLAAAVAFSMVVGIVLGLMMGTYAAIRPYLRSLIIIDTGIPALSWMLIAVFWFKNPEARIFFILTLILVPFYALNVYDGMRALSRDLVDMIESFRPSRLQVLHYLVAPHIVPYVFLTTRSVIGYAIRMAIFAELVASAVGIGSRMSLAQSTFHIDQVLAWTIFLVVFNLLVQGAVALLEKRLLKWRPEASVR